MQKSILIGTFSFRKNKKRTALNGMIEPLLSYFLNRTKKIVLIDGSHPGSDTVHSYIEFYEKGKLLFEKKSFSSTALSILLSASNSNSTQVLFKIRDLFSVIEMYFITKTKFDLFIGLESIFTIGGLVLKKLGKVKTVVYYVSDYTPTRYPNKLLNSIYLYLDRFCCYHSDYIWDVSPAMMPARILAGLNPKKCAPLILVPNALFPKQIAFLPLDKKKKNTIVFAGTFGAENGPDLAIRSLSLALKQNKKLKLHMIGGGDQYEKNLKQLAKKLKVNNHVIFHGFINNAIEVSTITKRAMIGIAPYRALPNSARWYADATKIRLYYGAGLPVITTQVPPIGKDKEIKKGLLTANDNEETIAKKIVEIFQNDFLFKKLRGHAIQYAKKNTWENTYATALKKMNFKLE